jgi:DNA polymerase alpha subunit B
LRATGVGNAKGDFLARLCQNVLQQRHYFPIFPPLDRQSLESSTAKDNDGMDLDYKTVGASLDISYSKLGEITTGLDVLALPSTLKPFVKASTHRITTSSRWCIN